MTQSIIASARPIQQPGVSARMLNGEAVLLNLTTEEYYSLNEVGTHIWHLADGDHTVATIAEALAAEYDAAPDEIMEDVTSLLTQLVAEGLVLLRDA